ASRLEPAVLAGAKPLFTARDETTATFLKVLELVVGGCARREDDGVEALAPLDQSVDGSFEMGRLGHINSRRGFARCFGKAFAGDGERHERGDAAWSEQRRKLCIILLT